MINKINYARFNNINFSAKKSPKKKNSENNRPRADVNKKAAQNFVKIENSKNVFDKMAYHFLLKPLTPDYYGNIEYYSTAKDLIDGFNSARLNIPAINNHAQKNFKYYKSYLEYWHDLALEHAQEAQNGKHRLIIEKPDVQTLIQYDKNLAPLYAVVKDEENETILDFDDKIIMKNYKKDSDSGEIRIDEVHVLDNKKTGNLYSLIANITGRKLSFYNVIQKSEKSLSANAAILYYSSPKVKACPLYTFINPDIKYIPSNNMVLINAQEKTINGGNNSVQEYLRKTKTIFQKGESSAEKTYGGKIEQMYNLKDKINYGIITFPPEFKASSTYVKLF